ncbi:MAG: acyl-CoA dehydrogenase family protein [Abditibacteriota bacterium]|nr:acyl-CoA dehydrogenase family protein [Abditibacteriota bacterium]MBP5738220.1 acyl-CoA dehydrogenase family protein [Abditibacteriota bacterium]
MDYFLTEEQQFMKDVAKDLAEKKIRPVSAEFDETGEFPWEIVKAIAEADLFRVFIPDEYGGMAGDSAIMNMCVVTEELSKVDGGISLAFAATGLGTFPILVSASDEQKAKWLPRIADGTVAAFALTEANAGSNAAGLATTAVEDGDSYIINGTKQWITNGGEADIYTVFAVTDPARGPRGLSCFVVEKGTPGFTFGKKENKLGIRASATRELIFTDCRVPKENMIGRRGTGFITAMKTFDRSRPGVAAQAVGIAAGALELAIKYSTERKQFDQPINNFQGLRFMLADMAMKVESARALVYSTARWIDTNPSEKFTAYSAMAKCYASDMAMSVTTDAVQVFGGYGYMKEYPVEKMMRDAKITQIYEGTNQIQRDEIGRGIVAEVARKAK